MDTYNTAMEQRVRASLLQQVRVQVNTNLETKKIMML